MRISIDIIFSRDKSYRSSKDVIASVLRGEQLPEWDVGAYLVGVFACRPLTSDSQAYAEDKGQWPHCRFKEKWEAALQGKDTFAEKDRALIIAGAELARYAPAVHEVGHVADRCCQVEPECYSEENNPQVFSHARSVSRIRSKSLSNTSGSARDCASSGTIFRSGSGITPP